MIGQTEFDESYEFQDLKHLQYASGTGTIVYANGLNSDPNFDATKWEVNPDWGKEFGNLSNINNNRALDGDSTHVWDYLSDLPYGMTNAFLLTPISKTTAGFRYIEGYGNDTINYAGSGGMSRFPKEGGDDPRDTEVWFIDSGPRVGTINVNKLDFPNPYIEGAVTPTNIGNVNAVTSTGAGFEQKGNTFNMELGFGGIMQSEYPTEAENNYNADVFLFNYGDWFLSPSEETNEFYKSSSDKSWAENFVPGRRFKWDEDPNGNEYEIGDTNAKNSAHTRHSHTTYAKKNHSSGSVASNGSTPPPKGVWKLTSSEIGIGAKMGEDNTFSVTNEHGGNMAEDLSFNLTKAWNLTDCIPVGASVIWDPTVDGPIINGLEVILTAAEINVITSSGSFLTEDLKIFVTDIKDLHVGMALQQYVNTAGTVGVLQATTHLGVDSNEFLVVRHIVDQTSASTPHFELWLGGYRKPMTLAAEHRLATTAANKPKKGTNYKFVQVGMNGYSPNSEFNINTMGAQHGNNTGKVGAVGYTLSFLEQAEEEEDGMSVLSSSNPAIFETEPKEARELDIYHEATAAIPINIDASNIHEAIPIGSIINEICVVTGYAGSDIQLSRTWSFGLGSCRVVRPDGLDFEVDVLSFRNSNIFSVPSTLTVEPFLYNEKFFLGWHNCFSFGNGVESDRIRDNFNLAFIANGVKASTTVEQEYKEEHRKYGLIYSGLYNSTSGVNNLNQFIMAEKITKDVNPIYGSIQKLHSRDSDLVTLCEDKCLRILANKDAVFNADGNPNLTATENVLGQTIPFSGEYGISTNPESFASESYRVYFTDKARGAVIRLSKDGITPISNHGMKDWFKDNLKLSTKLLGSHDDKKDEYNITLSDRIILDKNDLSVSSLAFWSRQTHNGTHGWEPVTLNSTDIRHAIAGEAGYIETNVPRIVEGKVYRITYTIVSGSQGSLILANHTTISSRLNSAHTDNNVPLIGELYPGTYSLNWLQGPQNVGKISIWCNNSFEGSISNIRVQEVLEGPLTVTFKEDVRGWVSFKSFVPENAMSMTNDYYTFLNGNLYKHHDEAVQMNTFYEINSQNNVFPVSVFAASSVTVVLNDFPSNVKEFNTLNYEGSQSKINKFVFVDITDPNYVSIPFQPDTDYSDQEYYNLYSKEGWEVESIITNKEDGYIDEFIEKEGKWFNNIKRTIDLELEQADTADFSFQGIDFCSAVTEYDPDAPVKKQSPSENNNTSNNPDNGESDGESDGRDVERGDAEASEQAY